MVKLIIPIGYDRDLIPSSVYVSTIKCSHFLDCIPVHASGPGHVDAREAAAAAAEELQNPEGEDQGSVLLHGPVVVGQLGKIRGGVVCPSQAEGADLALGSESVDSDSNPSAEVSTAEAGHAAGSDDSKHGLHGTDAHTNRSEEDKKHNDTHAHVDVRPARASLLAVFITVFHKIRQQLSSCLRITVGSTALSVINDVVDFMIATVAGLGSFQEILCSYLHVVDGGKSSEVECHENKAAEANANSLSNDHLFVFLLLSFDHGFRTLHRHHRLHTSHRTFHLIHLLMSCCC